MLSPRPAYSLELPGRRPLALGERTLIMGVLNVTPDSFAEEEPLTDPARAIDRALRMEADGADVIDIGGESTRPGAEPVSEADEIARVLPVVRGLAGRLGVPMSIDTYRARVARLALDEGAAMVNDVSGLLYDPALAGVAAHMGAAVVLMHTRGRSRTMYAEADYADLVGEVAAELRDAVARATGGGVPRERLVVDPGLGFAKRAPHSYGVLARLFDIQSALDLPILVGPSRKSFMREALGDAPAPRRDWGTAAAVAAAVLGGAHIVRVHAVAEMRQVVRVADELRKAAR